MNEEERALLNKITQTVEDNNEILHDMRRSMRWASVFRWFYWILIIGSAIGSFYFIQPYLNSLADTYTGAKSDVSSFKDVLSSFKQ